MPKTRPPYAAEFRQQMVDLVRSGRAPEDLAREFEPSSQTIRTWVAQVGRDAGERSDGLRTEEREASSRRSRSSPQGLLAAGRDSSPDAAGIAKQLKPTALPGAR